MPWIHVDDLCAIYLEAITKTHRWMALIMPQSMILLTNTFWLRFMYKICLLSQVFDQDDFGEMSKIVLTGRRISSDKLEETGFHFKHRNLEDTLRDCLSK
jgi:NAD dependent epimerase/dehydratase family enzyme